MQQFVERGPLVQGEAQPRMETLSEHSEFLKDGFFGGIRLRKLVECRQVPVYDLADLLNHMQYRVMILQIG